MAEDEPAQTRLEQVLRQRHWTVREFLRQYQDVAGEKLSERQAYRWIAGNLRKLPYPHAQAALERLFSEPVTRLLGPAYGLGQCSSVKRHDNSMPLRGSMRTDWEGQVIAMCADRARDFLARAESSNAGTETIDQIIDDVRRLVTLYQQQPLESILTDVADTQDRTFTLLEGRQRPERTRDLYLLAGITSGLMAKASHDLGASHDALTQARAAYACADNAGHNGLRVWTRGLQALITYWAGRFNESLRYAELGTEAAVKSRGTAVVWLASSKARTLSALNQLDEAHAAIDQASAARERVEPDELDNLGGLCTFGRPRQLYYAADALAWGGEPEASATERIATEALNAYAVAPATERAFGDESGTRCALAVARILRGQIDGAADALAPVLQLPPAQRIHGIVTSVDNVRRTLQGIEQTSPVVVDLADAIESFSVERLTLSN